MAEDLQALAAEAAAIDAEAAPAALAEVPGSQPEAPAAPQVDPAESLAGFLAILSIAAGYAGLDRTAAIWTPETCRGLADKAVPVLVKYAWGQRILNFLATGAGVEELALAAYAAPLVLATAAAVKDDLKPKRPAPPQPADA
jgi:hypothetical protein